MTKLAYRRSIVKALLILYISTRVGWVIGPMPPLLYSNENGPFPTVNMDGWAPRLVQTGRERENFFAPNGEDKSKSAACSKSPQHLGYLPSQPYRGWWYEYGTQEGKNNENFISWRFMRHLLHLWTLVFYVPCIYLLSKLHKALLKNM